jgi:predicted nucleotidyltransferase
MSSVDWQRLEQVLAAAPNVVVAWVFGSAQSGRVRPGGDLDVGVLFESKPSLDELLKLTGDLQQALQFAEIDVVPLNDANPILCFEAISGRAVFCRDAALPAGPSSPRSRRGSMRMSWPWSSGG